MLSVTHILQPNDLVLTIWLAGVWAAALFLVGLGIAVFAWPQASRAFLGGYASTWRLNTLEAVLRFGAGLSFMGASTEMLWSQVFFWFGAMLAVTAIPILLLYRLHQTFARWAVPFAYRILPLYGGVSILMGLMIIYARLVASA